MDYKFVFTITKLLISSPARAWEEIRLHTALSAVTANYVYPMIGMGALSVFLGCIFEQGWSGPEAYQYAMLQCCAVVVALFGGFFLSSSLIDRLMTRWFQLPTDLPRCQAFVGYSMSVLFTLQVITGVLPDLGIISMLLRFYTIYLVWEGTAKLFEIPAASRVNFTIAASAIILICPWLVELVFNKLNAVFN